MTTFEPPSMPLTRPQNAPDYFHVMAKPTGAICNLVVEYCFFRDEVETDFVQFIPIIERATREMLPIANRGWGDQNLPSSVELESLAVAKSSKRPLYTLEGSLVTERSVNAEQWGKFLVAIYDEWVRNDVGKVYIQSFESALGSWVGRGVSLCIHRSTCGDALALEHNGDLYSCDHFVEPKYFLGNQR
jgi:uncharacterized protein